MDHIHDRSQLLTAEEPGRGMVDDRIGVVYPNLTTSCLLHLKRGHPGAIDVFICVV